MNSYDLCKRLEALVIIDEVRSDNQLGKEAAARIRELEARVETLEKIDRGGGNAC